MSDRIEIFKPTLTSCISIGDRLTMTLGKWKNPTDAFILGLLVVGLGHIYLGKWGKGLALFLITVVATLFITIYLAPVFWIISCVSAYYDAKSYNRGWGYPNGDGDIDDEETDEDVEEETERDKFCSNCGKPLLQDENFCPRCGKSTQRSLHQ